LALFADVAFAQQRTGRDAGELLRFYSPDRISTPVANTISVEETKRQRHLPHPENDPAIGPGTITIKSIRFDGNELISDEQLIAKVRPYYGKPLRVKDLADAAFAAAEAYHKAGYIAAQVVVPPQEIFDGEITMLVFEGLLDDDGINIIDYANATTSLDYVRGILSRLIKSRVPIRRHDYIRALRIVENLPGVHLRSKLYPSKKAGSARLAVELYQTTTAYGSLSHDNFGFYGTGQRRTTVQAIFDNAAHKNESVSFIASTTGRHQRFANIEVEIPVGYDGLKVSAMGSYLDYRLRDEFNTANQHGEGGAVGLHATYPLVLLKEKTINLTGRLERSFSTDKSDDAEDFNRTVDVAELSLHGEFISSSGVTAFAGTGADDVFHGLAFIKISNRGAMRRRCGSHECRRRGKAHSRHEIICAPLRVQSLNYDMAHMDTTICVHCHWSCLPFRYWLLLVTAYTLTGGARSGHLLLQQIPEQILGAVGQSTRSK
jgi:hemolysin activation/secretion protein